MCVSQNSLSTPSHQLYFWKSGYLPQNPATEWLWDRSSSVKKETTHQVLCIRPFTKCTSYTFQLMYQVSNYNNVKKSWSDIQSIYMETLALGTQASQQGDYKMRTCVCTSAASIFFFILHSRVWGKKPAWWQGVESSCNRSRWLRWRKMGISLPVVIIAYSY